MRQGDVEVGYNLQVPLWQVSRVKSVLSLAYEKADATISGVRSHHTLKLVRRFAPAAIGLSVQDIASHQNAIFDIGWNGAKLLPLSSHSTDQNLHVLLTVEPGSSISVHSGVEVDVSST